MKRLLWFMLLPLGLLAQPGSPSRVVFVGTAPSGACSASAALQYVTAGGDRGKFYGCGSGGTWALLATAGGSGTCPAGSDTQVQFNSSGACGASANLTFASNQLRVGATGTMFVGPDDGGFMFAPSAISTPSTPTVTPQGTGGSSAWGYNVFACSDSSARLCTDGSVEGTTAIGNATLTGSNFNRLAVTAVTGAAKYIWYRNTVATSPSTTGIIGTTTSPTLDDTGLAGNDPGDFPFFYNISNGIGASRLVIGNAQTDFLPAVQGLTFGTNVINVIDTGANPGLTVMFQTASGGEAIWGLAYSTANSGTVSGVEGEVVVTGTSTVGNGLFGFVNIQGAGSAGRAVYAFPVAAGGAAVAGLTGVYIESAGLFGGATATNIYGLNIADQSGGTNNYAIKTGIGLNSFGDNVEVANTGTLASESLTNGALTSGTSWAAAGDFALASNAATYTHSAGSGTITQTSGDMAIAGISNRWYLFVYTVSAITGTAPACTITTGFASAATSLTVVAGAQSTQVLAKSSPGNFVLSCTSSGASTVTFDTLSLKEITGGNLFVGGTVQPGAYKSADGSTGFSGTACTTFKNGLCVAGT